MDNEESESVELEDLVLRLLLGLFLNRIYDWFEHELTKCTDFIMDHIQRHLLGFFYSGTDSDLERKYAEMPEI